MSNKLIAVLMLFVLNYPAHAQDAVEASADAVKPTKFSTLRAVTALSESVGDLLQNYFTAMEALATDESLITSIKDQDTEKLQLLSTEFQSKLDDSLMVRLFIRGEEKVDNESTPACGFACIEIVRAAYVGKPDAEALLFRSQDANITLARGIQDSTGQTIGAIAVHYPFNQLKSEIQKLTADTVFTELRQRVSGSNVVLTSYGDKAIKLGAAQKLFRIPQSTWAIAVWTPGGVSIETYEPPAIPWFHIVLAAVVLVLGIITLVVYHIKNPQAARQKKVKPIKVIQTETSSPEAISYDHEYDSPTLIMGGGADGVDVSDYLKDEDITSLKNKFK